MPARFGLKLAALGTIILKKTRFEVKLHRHGLNPLQAGSVALIA